MSSSTPSPFRSSSAVASSAAERDASRRDSVYESPGDLRSLLVGLRRIGVCMVLLAASSLVMLNVEPTWGRLLTFFWVALICGLLVRGWQAGTAVLLLLALSLFGLPVIFGGAGPRYVVWEIGARGIAAAAGSWLISWISRSAVWAHLTGQLAGTWLAAAITTAVALWLQRQTDWQHLLPSLLAAAVVVGPVVLVYRMLQDRLRL